MTERTEQMKNSQVSRFQTADDLISGVSTDTTPAKGWEPPPHFVPELDKIIAHNKRHPDRRIGSIKIAAWLGRNGIQVSKDAVYRWIKHRSKGSK